MAPQRFSTRVVGVSYRPCRALLRHVPLGTPALLVPAPDHPADAHAIEVWLAPPRATPWHAGYIGRGVAARLAPAIASGVRYQGRVVAVRKRGHAPTGLTITVAAQTHER